MRRTALWGAPLALLAAGSLLVTASPASSASHHGRSGLAGLAARDGRYFGAAVSPDRLSGNATYAGIVNSQFDMLTPDNAMKWDTIEPSPGVYDFGPGDQVVAYAKAHGDQVRGHNLVWHSQLPAWVSALPADQVRGAMESHIKAEAGHYRGQVYAWDVVNEPFNDDGTLRATPFSNAMGVSYIADALRTAHRADPHAKLYINDYNIEGLSAKSDAMYDLVKQLKAQHVPIDGVGVQGHLDIQYGFPTDMRGNLERFAKLGVDVAITELDVRMTLPEDATKDATQIEYYDNVVDACLAVRRCVGITTWGVGEPDSWIPGVFTGEGQGLLYDENYQPKPVYYAVAKTLAAAAHHH